MANYDIAYLPTGRIEGGYANNKNDSGGMTAFGLTRRDWPKWFGWAIIDKLITSYGLKKAIPMINANLQLKLSAKQIFKTSYWDVCQCDLINNQAIAWQCFDSAINMGAGTAAELLQQSCGADIDFHVGPATLKLVNASNSVKLYETFVADRKARYDKILSAHPTYAEFKASWYSRCNTPYQIAMGANNIKLMTAA